MTARRPRLVLAALATTVLAVVACAPAAPSPSDAASPEIPWRSPASTTDAAAAVAALPVADLATDVVSRAAADVVPPTNRWYSGVVFGDAPHRIIPFPLAVDVRADGFALTLPGVAVTPTSIVGSEAPALSVGIPSESFEIVRADPVSVTARYVAEGSPVGDLTVAEGWPVVGFTAVDDVVLAPGAPLASGGDGTWTATIGEQEFGVRAPGATLENGGLRVPAGGSAQWFAVPSDSDAATWTAALGDPVSGVTTLFATGDDTVSTRLVYDGTEATVVVPFPGSTAGDDCGLGTFETPYGTTSACAATAIEREVPLLQARDTYDWTGLAEGVREGLVTQIAQDLEATPALPADTYFGGKGLARLGALLTLARTLGAEELAESVADRLTSELEPWVQTTGCDERTASCFVYDEGLRLVTAGTPSFGSEEGNDHHFHYGYFLAAAAALAEARPELVDTLAPVMDALAADIAAGTSDDTLPGVRVFDPYRGHSWASGLSPFADGNNQESSSEAVAAWNGLALWAGVRGDAELAETATWLLSSEAASARELWLEPELPEAYDHTIVSLTWGNKRDYATWFSGEPSAILGIQALPIGPISLDYLASDPSRVADNVADAGGDAAFAGPLGEYVLQYSALGGADALAHAESVAATLDPAALDDGTSLSTILAWLAAVRLEGAP